MDRIIIEQLCIDTFIGVHEWERSVRQSLILNVALSYDAQKASVSDQLRDAVDYAQMAERITAFANENQFQLIEAFAGQLAQLLLEEFPINQVEIDLCKPGAITGALSARIRIERSRGKK